MHNYGERKCSKKKSLNDSIEPVRCFGDGISVKVLLSNSKSHPSLVAVEQALERADMYSYLSLEDFLPENSQRRYAFIRRLEDGLKMSCVLLTYSNKGNFHFVWKYDGSEGEILEKSQATIETVRREIPTFHTRAMRKLIQEKFGRLSPKIKPHQFRFIYKDLTCDCSQGNDLTEKEVDD